jgi:hypothetical protein
VTNRWQSATIGIDLTPSSGPARPPHLENRGLLWCCICFQRLHPPALDYQIAEMDVEEEYAYDILLKIPPEHAHRILDASVPVSTLLQHPCPPLSGALALVHASELFTQLEPNFDLDWFFQVRPIPDASWTTKAKEQLKVLYNSGRKIRSLHDPEYMGVYLPVWALQVWDRQRAVVRGKEAWRKSLLWAKAQKAKSTECAKLVEDLEENVAKLGWDEYIGNLSVRNLHRFLADGDEGWLASDTADLSTDLINKKIYQNPSVPQDIMIAPTTFYQSIEEGHSRWSELVILSDYLALARNRHSRLYFLVNVNNIHWITFLIDFRNDRRALFYG